MHSSVIKGQKLNTLDHEHTHIYMSTETKLGEPEAALACLLFGSFLFLLQDSSTKFYHELVTIHVGGFI